jgi:uncharacterized protein
MWLQRQRGRKSGGRGRTHEHRPVQAPSDRRGRRVTGDAGRPTIAATVDCAQATSPYDKLICATPDLAAVDAQMDGAVERTRAQLSAEGGRLLGESQRSWLEYLRGAFPVEADCLRNAYAERFGRLGAAVVTVGPYRLQSVDRYAATPLAHAADAAGGGPA